MNKIWHVKNDIASSSSILKITSDYHRPTRSKDYYVILLEKNRDEFTLKDGKKKKKAEPPT